MKTKEEIIKEAYARYWELLTKDQKEKVIIDDGWCHCRLVIELSLSGIQDDSDCGYYVRPKQLKGIETNNGWTKIESESDLPIHTTLCHIIRKCGKQGIDNIYKNKFFVGEIIYYQPIQKPEPPLY